MDNKCSSLTKKGTQCTRVAKFGSKCALHKGEPDMLPLSSYPYRGMCITITWCDRAENHKGMEIIGDLRKDVGDMFTCKYLKKLHKKYEGSELINLKDVKFSKAYRNVEMEDACILVIRNYVKNADDLLTEMKSLEWDKKALMRGRVVNKTARYNLCFSKHSSKPDYDEGKGTVVPFRKVAELNKLKTEVNSLLPKDDVKLVAEGNYYYNIYNCNIGYHGDKEREFVIGTRFGDSFCLHYQWYHRSEEISKVVTVKLNHGDLYIMSKKATGFDWMKSSQCTLRHSASLGDCMLVREDDSESSEDS